MRDDGGQAIFFYSRHPITVEIILSNLRASRGNLDGLRPEDLYPHDQDHYGGLDANDVLVAATGICFSSIVVNLLSRQRRKDWRSVRKGACVWIFRGAKALPGRPLAPAIAPIRGSRR